MGFTRDIGFDRLQARTIGSLGAILGVHDAEAFDNIQLLHKGPTSLAI